MRISSKDYAEGEAVPSHLHTIINHRREVDADCFRAYTNNKFMTAQRLFGFPNKRSQDSVASTRALKTLNPFRPLDDA